MLPEESPSPHHAKLAAVTREYAFATVECASHERHKPLSEFLWRVREALGMDIAFVSQFVDDQRVFRIVNVASHSPLPLASGQSDPLVDSYCRRIVEGRLPMAIPDTTASAETRDLAITQRLRIGAYLSVPIVLKDGSVYGTLCCFSHLARPGLGECEILGLQDVASVIAAAMDQPEGQGCGPLVR